MPIIINRSISKPQAQKNIFKSYPDGYLKKCIEEALLDNGPLYDPKQVHQEMHEKLTILKK